MTADRRRSWRYYDLPFIRGYWIWGAVTDTEGNAASRRRRALTIGVSGSPSASAGSLLEPLAFTAELVPDLATTLQNLGYETVAVAEDTLTTEALGARVTAELESAGPDDLLLVHVISHGHAADGNATVYVLGSDGSPHQQTDVAHWLANLQNVPGRPLTLFLLDLCFAGTAARLPWQSDVDPHKVRGWVIAACRSRQVAYDGRFTAAVTNVLRSVQEGALDIDPGVEHVPLRTVARAIHQEVNRLVTEADAADQQVTASLIDMSVEPDLPFFRNPAYTNDSRSRLRMHLEPGLLPFLDDMHEGLDTKHFLERAAGVGRLAEHAGGLVGCFSGRERELRRLSPWMNGVGAETLAVVTGSPGVGKSALLGVLVCAGHPLLREPTKPVWDRVAQAPYPIDGLAAVHARSRGLGQIVESIAVQLDLPAEVSAVELISLISERATPAVVVLDALDEADGAETILNELLLPMVSARQPDGSVGVRLLVGLRPYPEFQLLLTSARQSGLFVDLDDVPGEVLEDDLHKYVTELLRAVPKYRLDGGAVSGAFANEVARVLAAAREDAEGRRWGPFLVAGLYTRHLVTTHPEPSQLDATQAKQLGAKAPSTLPEVLELDLKGRLDQPWLRPVMAVLAQARGQGMPITIIARAAAALDTRLPTPTLSDIRGVLGEAKFFLRQATDTDRTTVYRLFHQGLVDHLGAHPFDSDRDIDYPGVLLNALLAPLGPAQARGWAAAEPYLFRHVLDHAAEADRIADILTDPGFLLHPKAAELLAELDPVHHRVLELLAELRRGGGPAVSRDALALAAVRHGLADLARRTGAMPLPTPMSWQPRWIVGPPPRVGPDAVGVPAPLVDPVVELRSAVHNGAVRTVSLSSDSHLLVSRGADASVRMWDHTSAQPPYRSSRLPEAVAVGLSTDGRHLALGNERGSIHLLDLVSFSTSFHPALYSSGIRVVAVRTGGGELVSVDVNGQVLLRLLPSPGFEPVPTARIGARSTVWAATFEDLGPFVVSGDADGAVRIWDARSGKSMLVARHPGRVVSVALGGGGRSIVSAGEDGSVRVRTGADDLVWRASVEATAVAVEATGRMVAIGDKHGGLSLWDTATDSLIDRWAGHHVPVTAIALSADAHVVGFGDEAGTIGIWRPASTSSRPADPPHGTAEAPPLLCAVAMGPGEGRPTVLVGDAAGLVSAVHLESGELTGQTCKGTEAVRTIAFQQVGERYLTRVSWAGNETRLWEPASGTVIEAGAWAGLPTVAQIDASRRTVLLKDQLVEVIGQPDGAVHLRDAAQQGISDTLSGRHDGPVTAVTCGLVLGRPTAFTGGDDGTVRVWDLLDLRLVEVIQVPGPVFGISYADGDLLVGAGGEVIAFRRHVGSEYL